MVDPAADTLGAPGDPLVQDLAHAHDTGIAGDEDVEVAREGVLQRGRFEELLHEAVGVRAALQVDGQAKAGEVRLVPHVVDLADLPRLDELGHLVQDRLAGGGVGDLGDLDHVLLLEVAPAGPDLDAAPAGAVHRLQRGAVIDHLGPRREVRRGDQAQQVRVPVAEDRDRGVADLVEVEAADLARHADGDAGVGRDQDVREGRGQERRLEHGAVVVVREVHGVFVDVLEQGRADLRELRLGIARGRVGHVAGVDLAEVPLRVDEGREQGLVARGEADHGLVDRRVAVGVELHGLAHDVRALRARARQQAHLVHGVEELAVGGLEAVDLRDGAGDDDAHGVGHVVLLQRVGDGLLRGLAPEPEDVGVGNGTGGGVVGRGFLLHLRLRKVG